LKYDSRSGYRADHDEGANFQERDRIIKALGQMKEWERVIVKAKNTSFDLGSGKRMLR
jgi:hypothetical protein